MPAMPPDPLGVTMERMGSGTTWVPDAAPIPARHAMVGSWDLTGHGFVFVQEDRQSGPRGGSQLGSLNWGMLMASHELAGGRFQLRTMLSVDAATVTARGYPLLLQTGESFHGESLHDRQHPHDFFMELGALYEREINRRVGAFVYAAPSGEPALGPVAFMHRPSAMDIPFAPIGHHWQDATHISFGVLTAGLFSHRWKLEASAFNGREPDENRWNLDPIRLDSYSARATFNPTSEWSFTGGYGYINSPEALNPAESMHRLTASALHGVTVGTDGQWASALIYGANASSSERALAHSLLLESELIPNARDSFVGRAEFVQKTAAELVLDRSSSGFDSGHTFDVGSVSLGYIREVARFSAATIGLGAMGTLNVVPGMLENQYGSRTPIGVFLYLRVRPFGTRSRMADMPRMKME